ncbi:MAG: ectoine utilization protein EutA, partial [Albidovulum sp.]|uniref:aspartate racemase/maleate isomerase family protein n=1 Tax=Albidovulum sp. TaxID=1872424 RepID=UPI003CB644FA
ATDLTSERDFARLVPQDLAAVHTARIAFENPTTPETLMRMQPGLTRSADLILPDIQLDAICYSCTAASVVIGDEAVTAAIHAARPGVPVVTPTGATRAAFRALGVQRIAILTPYLVKTSQPMAAYFTRHGLDVTRLHCLGMEDDREMARVSRDTIVSAAIAVDTAEAEALFISCTALPALGAVAEIEARTGKPVVTSNQASIWAMLRHAGLGDTIEGYGRLFSHSLPASGIGDAA